MTLPPKIAGGNILDCGHQQVVSEQRQRVAATGVEQRPVWCIECNAYQRLAPYYIVEPADVSELEDPDN